MPAFGDEPFVLIVSLSGFDPPGTLAGNFAVAHKEDCFAMI
jgi:hypothetical protein